MSRKRTIKAKRLEDGTLVELLPGGETRPFPADQTDWTAPKVSLKPSAKAAGQARVAGSGAGSKLKKVRKLGVKVTTEDDWRGINAGV